MVACCKHFPDIKLHALICTTLPPATANQLPRDIAQVTLIAAKFIFDDYDVWSDGIDTSVSLQTCKALVR